MTCWCELALLPFPNFKLIPLMGTVGILNLLTKSAESTMVVHPESTRILAGFCPMVPLKMNRESDFVEIGIESGFEIPETKYA